MPQRSARKSRIRCSHDSGAVRSLLRAVRGVCETLRIFGDGASNSVSITGGENAQQYLITGLPDVVDAT
jgi:hypothetical protein